MQMSLNKKKTALSVTVVEQHNDALPVIHRAIASKRLPFHDVAVLHFDSHPDLLLSPKLDADIIFKPHQLYDELSIENWLLPLTYAKHVNNITWVKPPWAQQIKSCDQNFVIGKCKESGKVRLTCKENYFLTDGLFQSENCLCNTSNVRLVVKQLLPDKWNELDQTYFSDNIVQDRVVFKEWKENVNDIFKESSYVLDIDLDFFTTANPFKDMLKPEEETALRNLYAYSSPPSLSDKDILSFSSQRQEQLGNLEKVFVMLETKLSEHAKFENRQNYCFCVIFEISILVIVELSIF